MRKVLMLLSCAAFFISACGKDETKDTGAAEAQKQRADTVEYAAASNLMSAIEKSPTEFMQEFKQCSDAQRYYFCAAFAMGAMSVSKPVTASAMVNYFMGLGVARYSQGIDDDTYAAFNAGKHVFQNEALVNMILEKGTCEVIMNDAAEFAKKRNYDVKDLDKRGKREVAKAVKYIQDEE